MALVEVILKKDIEHLGEEGDIKKVKLGYARNYLLPLGFVVYKTSASLVRLKKERHEIEERKHRKYEASRGLFERLNGLDLIFEMKVSNKGTLFGSITQKEIHSAICSQLELSDDTVLKNRIRLPHPIKNLGIYSVGVLVYGDLIAKLKVAVLDKNKIEDEQKKDTEAQKIENQQFADSSDISAKNNDESQSAENLDTTIQLSDK